MTTVPRAMGPGEVDAVEAMLAVAGLPTDGVREHWHSFLVISDGDAVLAAGGLELYGEVGLLRSLVVRADLRGRGHGQAVCAGLLEAAATRGVRELYLLTTGADRFFERIGFEAVSREQAPEAIRVTGEFADLCPASATLMRWCETPRNPAGANR